MATLEVNRFFFSFFLLEGIESPSMVIVRAWMRLKNMYMGSLPMAFESRLSRDSTNVTFVKLHCPSKLVMVSEVVVHGFCLRTTLFALEICHLELISKDMLRSFLVSKIGVEQGWQANMWI
jgi:hypothetical protein